MRGRRRVHGRTIRLVTPSRSIVPRPPAPRAAQPRHVRAGRPCPRPQACRLQAAPPGGRRTTATIR